MALVPFGWRWSAPVVHHHWRAAVITMGLQCSAGAAGSTGYRTVKKDGGSGGWSTAAPASALGQYRNMAVVRVNPDEMR